MVSHFVRFRRRHILGPDGPVSLYSSISTHQAMKSQYQTCKLLLQVSNSVINLQYLLLDSCDIAMTEIQSASFRWKSHREKGQS